MQTLDSFAEVIERKRLSIKALKEETREFMFINDSSCDRNNVECKNA
ncbi:hypothetical protein ACVNP1_09235 [Staphylococcus aureus]